MATTEPEPTDAAPAPAVTDLPPDRVRSRRALWWVLGPLVALVLAGIVTGSFVRAPYIMFAPGSARPTEPLISLPSGRGHSNDGDVLFTTVSVVRPTYLEALWGWLKGDTDVYPRSLIYGDTSDDENRRQNLADMNQSKLLAAKVALEHLGYDVDQRGTGVRVLQVAPGSGAADAGIVANDTITAIDGQEVSLDSQLVAELGTRAPGDTVTLTVDPGDGGKPRDVKATLGAKPGTTDPVLGVVIETRGLRFDLPFDVGIDSGEVGGPSAGLAFTLGVLDRLTPGSITGGHRVAVTGAIAADGRVEEVGGVAQKAVAAQQAGAEMFIVPTGEYAEAKAHAGDMEVVKVDTLDEALAALARLGGNAERLGRPGAKAGT